MKVSLFSTCLIDMFQPNVGIATVELLTKLGCEVDFPKQQICCGQPSYNSGYVEDSKKIMKRMIEAFKESEYIVVPSGSCAFMLKEYETIFKDDPKWAVQSKQLGEKVFELTDFIVNVLNIEEIDGEFHRKITYHPSCHMTRLLGIKDEPLKLLKNFKGIEYEELPNSYQCCGFGGTFSIKMGRISEQMVDEKIQHIEETNANCLVGADCGCLLNIGGRIERLNKNIEVLHIAEVLNKAVQ